MRPEDAPNLQPYAVPERGQSGSSGIRVHIYCLCQGACADVPLFDDILVHRV